MTDSKIIKLNTHKLPILVKEKESKKQTCGHHQILLDQGRRMIECSKCGQVIDPFEYLLDWAYGDRNLNYIRSRIREEIKEIHPILEELKKDERNTRARIKRLGLK